MRAVRIEKPCVFEENSPRVVKQGFVTVTEMEKPVRRRGEALLKLLYGGICGSDNGTFKGTFAYAHYPLIPGHEFSAQVIDVDEDNAYGIRKGMIVTCNPYMNCGHCYSDVHGHVNACMDNQTLGCQQDGAFREYFTMPVERVCRPDRTFRGFEGQITSGTVHVGDLVTSLPSMEQAHVREILDAEKPADCEIPQQSIYTMDSNHAYAERIGAWDFHVPESSQGHAVTITLDREIDTSRGCVLEMDSSLEVGSLFVIHLLWMDDHSLVAGRNFWLKIGTQQVPATVMKIRCRIDVNSGAEVHTDELFKNEIAVCEISTGSRIVFDRFENNREMGSLILTDRVSNMTSACGTIIDTLERGNNLTWQDTDITRSLRESQKTQKAITVWMTGLSGSGKSTLSNALEKRLFALDRHTMLLDGDNVRMGLCRDLSFSEADRIENIRRIANVAKLMNDAGLIVMTAFISPFRQDRQRAKEIIGDDSFFEVYVSTPLEECEKRDVKGLYQKARDGKIRAFTGISSPYEAPLDPDVTIDTSKQTIEESVDLILKAIEKKFGEA